VLSDNDEAVRFTPLVDSRPDDVAWPQLAWPPEPGVRLIGSAVTLTEVDPSPESQDADELFAALDQDAVWRHVAGRPSDPADFRVKLAAFKGRGHLVWLVRLTRPLNGLPTGTVVGTSSYLDVVPGSARLEIGWTLYRREVWGSAVNPDTKLQLLRYAFEALDAGRVQLKTDVRNARSQQAIARLGAQYEGTLRRYQPRSDGTMRDTVMFSITAEEWPRTRDGLLRRLSI
jgi:RimJ/RimL family protein N-acetyltransferase